MLTFRIQAEGKTEMSGALAFITNYVSSDVSVIDTSTNGIAGTVTVGAGPVGVAVSPDGSTAFVSNSGGNNLSVIDTSTLSVTSTITLGANTDPSGIAISPSGTTLYLNQAWFEAQIA